MALACGKEVEEEMLNPSLGNCKNGDPINRVRYAGGAGLEVEATEGEVPETRDRAGQYQR